jgi:hypothetical protein
MIPEKDKTYAIACLGPYDYNMYRGTGVCLGSRAGDGSRKDPFIYSFRIPNEEEPWFAEEDIIVELKNL